MRKWVLNDLIALFGLSVMAISAGSCTNDADYQDMQGGEKSIIEGEVTDQSDEEALLGCFLGVPNVRDYPDDDMENYTDYPLSIHKDNPTVILPNELIWWMIDTDCSDMTQMVKYRPVDSPDSYEQTEISGQYGTWVWVEKLATTMGTGVFEVRLSIEDDVTELFSDSGKYYVEVPGNALCLSREPTAVIEGSNVFVSKKSSEPTSIESDTSTGWKVKNACDSIEQTLMCKLDDVPGLFSPFEPSQGPGWTGGRWFDSLATKLKNEFGSGIFRCYVEVGHYGEGQSNHGLYYFSVAE
jgi:hypothetical protein